MIHMVRLREIRKFSRLMNARNKWLKSNENFSSKQLNIRMNRHSKENNYSFSVFIQLEKLCLDFISTFYYLENDKNRSERKTILVETKGKEYASFSSFFFSFFIILSIVRMSLFLYELMLSKETGKLEK